MCRPARYRGCVSSGLGVPNHRTGEGFLSPPKTIRVAQALQRPWTLGMLGEIGGQARIRPVPRFRFPMAQYIIEHLYDASSRNSERFLQNAVKQFDGLFLCRDDTLCLKTNCGAIRNFKIECITY